MATIAACRTARRAHVGVRGMIGSRGIDRHTSERRHTSPRQALTLARNFPNHEKKGTPCDAYSLLPRCLRFCCRPGPRPKDHHDNKAPPPHPGPHGPPPPHPAFKPPPPHTARPAAPHPQFKQVTPQHGPVGGANPQFKPVNPQHGPMGGPNPAFVHPGTGGPGAAFVHGPDAPPPGSVHFSFHGHDFNRVHVHPFIYPNGWAYRRMGRRRDLPPLFLTPDYLLSGMGRARAGAAAARRPVGALRTRPAVGRCQHRPSPRCRLRGDRRRLSSSR